MFLMPLPSPLLNLSIGSCLLLFENPEVLGGTFIYYPIHANGIANFCLGKFNPIYESSRPSVLFNLLEYNLILKCYIRFR